MLCVFNGFSTAVASPTPSITNGDVGFCQVQLLHNGNVIADSAKMARNLQTVHLCASIPVQTGQSTFSIAWRFNFIFNDSLCNRWKSNYNDYCYYCFRKTY